MNEQKNSDIHLRPRFKIDIAESQKKLLTKFKDDLNDDTCKYYSRIVDSHIIIDVPKEEDHFWSPQLNIEIEQINNQKSVVKGLFGPKPQVWTLFMFIHFAVAVTFIGFTIMTYVKWTIKQDYRFSLIMVIALPIFWFILYFFGRIGKRKGHKQMDELYTFMMKTLEKNS